MEINRKELEEFKKLWLEEFSQVIDDERAIKEARRLLMLIKFATEPVPPTVDGTAPEDKIIKSH